MGKLLLVRPDKAGDAIKTIPVLRALVRNFPEDNISVLASQHNASLFEKEPGIRVFTLPSRWEKLSEAELSQALVECDRGYDKLILLPCDPTMKMLELIELIEADEKFTARFDPANKNEIDNIASVVDLALGTTLKTEWRNLKLSPTITENDKTEASSAMGKKSRPWIGVSPFAGTDQRTHPIDKWEKFLSIISAKEPETEFIFFGAKSEEMKLENLKKHLANPAQGRVVYPSSFRALGAYLLRMDGLVGVDSGPLHFALSLGVPSLGMMSGGDRLRWFPTHGPKDRIIRRGVLNRYPSVTEMLHHYRRWRKL